MLLDLRKHYSSPTIRQAKEPGEIRLKCGICLHSTRYRKGNQKCFPKDKKVLVTYKHVTTIQDWL